MQVALNDPQAPRLPVEVLVVQSPGCHFCEDAIEALEEIGRDHPLSVRVVEMSSPEGVAIVAKHRPALSPAVLINGQLFSSGRLPRKKLRRMLQRGI